jgi:hypothetical protein
MIILEYRHPDHQLLERRGETRLLLNSLFIITLRAGAVPPGDSLESLARRHGAGSRCQLRKAEEERGEVV